MGSSEVDGLRDLLAGAGAQLEACAASETHLRDVLSARLRSESDAHPPHTFKASDILHARLGLVRLD